jgi:hypothetical protein
VDAIVKKDTMHNATLDMQIVVGNDPIILHQNSSNATTTFVQRQNGSNETIKALAHNLTNATAAVQQNHSVNASLRAVTFSQQNHSVNASLRAVTFSQQNHSVNASLRAVTFSQNASNATAILHQNTSNATVSLVQSKGVPVFVDPVLIKNEMEEIKFGNKIIVGIDEIEYRKKHPSFVQVTNPVDNPPYNNWSVNQPSPPHDVGYAGKADYGQNIIVDGHHVHY